MKIVSASKDLLLFFSFNLYLSYQNPSIVCELLEFSGAKVMYSSTEINSSGKTL